LVQQAGDKAVANDGEPFHDADLRVLGQRLKAGFARGSATSPHVVLHRQKGMTIPAGGKSAARSLRRRRRRGETRRQASRRVSLRSAAGGA